MTRSSEDDDDRLFGEAVDLAIRLHGDAHDRAAQETLRRWRARSPAHERIWSEVAALHGMSGKVLGADRQPGPSRRGVLRGAGAAVTATAAGYLALPDLLTWARADHMTGTAMIRRIDLPDGSEATLGPDSALGLGLEAGHHRIDLLAGMALIRIAKEPVTVTAGAVAATASSCLLEVGRDADMATVSIAEGQADVRTDAGETARLSEGEWLARDRHRLSRGMRQPGNVAAWRDGVMIAEDELVSVLVSRIARWIEGRVVLADRRLGVQRVSGAFNLDQPKRALAAAVHPHGGRIRQITPLLTVVSSL